MSCIHRETIVYEYMTPLQTLITETDIKYLFTIAGGAYGGFAMRWVGMQLLTIAAFSI